MVSKMKRKDGIERIMKGMKYFTYKQATKFHDDVMKNLWFNERYWFKTKLEKRCLMQALVKDGKVKKAL